MQDYINGFYAFLTDETKAVKNERRLSQIKQYYFDSDACDKLLEAADPVVYETYSFEPEECSGDLSFGMTRIYPGKVGNEYYMTKGHYHTIRDTAEVYYGLSGKGMLVIENEQGEAKALNLNQGEVAYVPKGFAHRTVNVGDTALEFFYVFRSDAGHDYNSVEKNGFRLILENINGELRIRKK